MLVLAAGAIVFTSCRGHSPINYIDVPTILKLAKMLTPKYNVVYIRPTHTHLSEGKGYSDDGAVVSRSWKMMLRAQLTLLRVRQACMTE